MIWALGIILYLAVGAALAVWAASLYDFLPDEDDPDTWFAFGGIVLIWPLIAISLVPMFLGRAILRLGRKLHSEEEEDE